MKFYEIKEREHESNEDTEDLLRKLLPTDFLKRSLKRTRKVFSSIECAGYQLVEYRLALRIPSHDRLLSSFPASTTKSLLNLSSKTLRKAAILEFPTTFRKKLYPVLKAAKQEKRTAFFKVERLIIDGSLYRGPETIAFPLYGHLMDV